MSEAPSPADLGRLAARTRELVLDLETTRADVLSVADLNRALRQVLRNQVSILEFLAGSGLQPAPSGEGATATLATQVLPRPQASSQALPRPEAHAAPAASGAQARLGEPLVFEPDEPAVPALNGTNGAARLEAPVDLDAGEAASSTSAAAELSVAEQVLREARVLSVHMARSVVEAFDNRDKNYDKGLEKLNRWVSGGAGTPFQWRGDRAYLNPNGAGAAAVKNYEEQLMSRMGFSRRLGRLVVPGLQGEVIIYERPG